MNILETTDSKRLIPLSCFDVCKIDGLTKEQISKLYRRKDVTTHKSAYYLDKFIYHIKQKSNLTLKEYCKQYLQIDWPKCPISGKEVGFKIFGKGLLVSTFAVPVNRKFSPKFDEYCNRISIERTGNGNPMFGKEAWNKGLDNSDPRVKAMSEKRIGLKASDETRAKMRQIRAESPLKARHTIPHSTETVEKLKINTAKLWARGVFNRITSIHIKVRDFLKTLDLNEQFIEEYQIKYFSMDFAFPNNKIAIEAQGTYYHIDPRIYPNGPINAMQRRNFGRDIAKRKVCCDQQGWKIIEVWETEINDGTFKEYLLCKLKELGLLKN